MNQKNSGAVQNTPEFFVAQIIKAYIYEAGRRVGIISPAKVDNSATRGESLDGRYYERFTVIPMGVASRDGYPIDEITVTGSRPTLWPCSYDTDGGSSGGGGGGNTGGSSDGGGGLGIGHIGGGNQGSGDGTNPPTNPPTNPDPIPLTSVQISVSRLTAIVGDKYTVNIVKVPENTTDEITHVVLFAKNQYGEMYFHDTSIDGDLPAEFMARRPGDYTFRAIVIVNGAYNLQSQPSAIVSHKFPTRAAVKSRFGSKMDGLWAMSKDAATYTHTYEYAAMMYIDTWGENAVWEFDSQKSGDYLYAQLRFAAPFPANKERGGGDMVLGGNKWVVGIFHTHPGWDKASEPRVVGRSDGDPDPGNGIPAWIYEYKSDTSINTEKGVKPGITPDGARAGRGELIEYGGDGRTN